MPELILPIEVTVEKEEILVDVVTPSYNVEVTIEE